MTLLDFMRLFAEFRAASWDRWRDVLARLTPQVREFFAIVGRGAGKSRIVALLACFFASRDYPRAPGEFIYIGVFAPDRRQASVTFRYIVGLMKSVPALANLIVAERADSLELTNGVIVEVITASTAAPRGRAYALAIVEEAAFLPTDDSANPDVELLRAIRPALARVPGSLLAVVSSPYARRGVLYQAWRKYHEHPPSDVLLVQAATRELNPLFDVQAITSAYEDDPASAASEYGAQFRADVESFLTPDVLDSATAPGRHELPRVSGVSYAAFVDPAGGSGQDSMTLAVAHQERRDERSTLVLDLVREVRPPFSPEELVQDFAALLHAYGVTQVTGDRYAGEWPREQCRKHGVEYLLSERTKSDIYRDTLPLLNSARVELLDHARLRAQLGALERRTGRGGKDAIDHPPGAHDDLANAACGALLVAAQVAQGLSPEATTRALQHAVVNPCPSYWAPRDSVIPVWATDGVPRVSDADECVTYAATGDVHVAYGVEVWKHPR